MARPSFPDVRPGDLVACSLPAPSERWVELVRSVWEAGAAVIPVDARLPREAAARLTERARPTLVVASDGVTRIADPAGRNDLLAVVATSGSTGEPRLVELTREAVSTAVHGSAELLGGAAEEPWLLCLPPAHIGGMLVLWRHVILGAPVSIREFSVGAVRETTGVRFTSLVPTQLHRLLDEGVDLSRFRAVLIGGAALSPELAQLATARHVNAVTTYGLTESCGGVVYNGRAFRTTGVRIGEAGEVQLAGPTLMRGYRLDPDATATAFTDDGWLRTRDAGDLTGGVLTVQGRLDDAILSGGETIWPLAVESALSSHPQVAEVAVAGRADPEWGERVVAFVVPRNSSADPGVAAGARR
jgi:O-succinylbenzoic acid--CoA ligase